MEERLKEIERNMKSILKEVNKLFENRYINVEISLWPGSPFRPFRINLWDGQDHAPLSPDDYAGTSEELIEWIKKEKSIPKV